MNDSLREKISSLSNELKNATHGHCEVPQNYANNNSLGTWVNKVRYTMHTVILI